VQFVALYCIINYSLFVIEWCFNRCYVLTAARNQAILLLFSPKREVSVIFVVCTLDLAV